MTKKEVKDLMSKKDFRGFAMRNEISVRGFNAINRYGINEHTTHENLITQGGIGLKLATKIQELQKAYKLYLLT